MELGAILFILATIYHAFKGDSSKEREHSRYTDDKLKQMDVLTGGFDE